MDTNDPGPFKDGYCHRAGGAVPPFLHRLLSQVPDKLFTGDPCQNRITELREGVKLSEQLKIMLLELTKTEAGVSSFSMWI